MNSNNNELNNQQNENVNIERNNNVQNQLNNNLYRNINNNNIQNQKQKISLNFIILSIINFSVYYYGKYNTIEISNTSLCLWPIIYENQYYRFITHFFIHFGLFHLLLELLISFYLFLNAEKFLGSMLVFFYINVSLIFISSIYIILMLITKYICKMINYKENFDFMYECGMTPMLLSCFTFYFLFSKKKKKNINIMSIIEIKGNVAPWFILFILYFFTPNTSFCGNLSGIITAYIIYNYLGFIVLPKVNWIQEIEKSLKINKILIIYSNLLNRDEEFYQNLDELEKLCKQNFNKNLNNGIQMSEIRNE